MQLAVDLCGVAGWRRAVGHRGTAGQGDSSKGSQKSSPSTVGSSEPSENC